MREMTGALQVHMHRHAPLRHQCLFLSMALHVRVLSRACQACLIGSMGCMQGSNATGLSWLLLCASCEVRYSVLLAVEELLLLRLVPASSSGAHLLLFRQRNWMLRCARAQALMVHREACVLTPDSTK